VAAEAEQVFRNVGALLEAGKELRRWQFVFVMGARCLTDLDSVCRAVEDLEEGQSMRLRFVDLPRHRSLFSLP